MTNSSIPSLVALLRETLAEHRMTLGLYDCNVPEGADSSLIPPGTPAGVADLLAATDGLYLDHTTRLFRAEELTDQQFPTGLEGAELPDGSTLDDTSRFFFFGQARENPLLVDRDGSVWRVPDEGYVWYTGCRVEPVADTVSEFVRTWVASPQFQHLAGLEPSDLETSHWYRLLRLSGLAT
ncbi:hypothetical protein [Kitasatospora brasiliensis]|uniref:hypothetical protein n=1 Tax=Kitasatospora brasiliensis TaxID=3058040 RepID=UPI00292FB1AD|nr:hypothetical protein [Kitasatospora sp. K002]